MVVAIHTLDVAAFSGYVWFAFAGAALAGMVVYLLGSTGRGGATPVKLALAGAALSALLASLTSAVLLLDVQTLDQFRFWVVGSLAGRDTDVVAQAAPFLGGWTPWPPCRPGRSTRWRSATTWPGRWASGCTSPGAWPLSIVVLCGAATAAAGPIAFVGLTVPHVARAICGPDYRWILPWSLVLAPTLLLSADVVGRVIARPGEVQVGILTAFVGAPFFIALVRRRRLADL